MTTTPFRSDFYATDRALTCLNEAVALRRLSDRFDGPCSYRTAYRTGMRTYAKEAVKAARKYRRARQ